MYVILKKKKKIMIIFKGFEVLVVYILEFERLRLYREKYWDCDIILRD